MISSRCWIPIVSLYSLNKLTTTVERQCSLMGKWHILDRACSISAVIDGLRGEIERGRRSGKAKPAAEVLDRLELHTICAHGNYLIVFEPLDDGALILRVLHGARNVPGVLSSY